MSIYSKHLCFEFTTSRLNSVYSKNFLGENNPGFSIKLFNSNEEEIISVENESSCVKTVVEYFPSFNYVIQSGSVFQNSSPETNIYAHAVAAAHIPENMGGSLAFLTGLNLRKVRNDFSFFPPKEFDVIYDPVYQSSKLSFFMFHNAGVVHSIGGMIRYIN